MRLRRVRKRLFSRLERNSSICILGFAASRNHGNPLLRAGVEVAIMQDRKRFSGASVAQIDGKANPLANRRRVSRVTPIDLVKKLKQ